MTEWRTVVGFADYEVSNAGQVRRTTGGQGARAGRLLTWHTATSTGYPNVRMRVGGKTIGVNVHVLVARSFLGARPDGMQVRHLDGDKMNCHVSNLVYGTHAENQRDKVRHGTSTRGTKNPRAKIDEVKAANIRSDYGFGFSAKELASAYGLSESTVYRIVRGIYWQEASNRSMDRAAA
jgi:hypothetical protein